MANLTDKAKQILSTTVKILIVVGAVYFIYDKIATMDPKQWDFFKAQIASLGGMVYVYIAILFLMAFASYTLEVFKWKTLTAAIKTLPFWTAMKQVLASHTAAMVTPARLGEFGVRALYFKPAYRKKILGLTLIGNLAQLGSTLVFGLIGVGYLVHLFYKEYVMYFYLTLAVLFILTAIWYYLKAKTHFNARNTMVFGYAVGRFLLFSHMTYFILVVTGVEMSYQAAMACVTTMYFVTSFIPSFQALDAFIKGSVALFVFSLFGDYEVQVLCAATLSWAFNAMIPGLIGSYFILQFDTSQIFTKDLLKKS